MKNNNLKLLDIGYAIPGSILVCYGIAWLIEWQFGYNCTTAGVLIGLALGLVLTFVKIKRYIDSLNEDK